MPKRVNGVVNLYTRELLNKLMQTDPEGLVAHLCRRTPGTTAAAMADLIEAWVDMLRPPRNLVSNLIKPDRANFWSAVGELQVGASLRELGFSINMQPKIVRPDQSALTPDILASKSGLPDTVVEVFAIADDNESRRQQRGLDDVAEVLRRDLQLPDQGFLSLSLRPRPDWNAAQLHSMTQELLESLNRWLQTADYGSSYRPDSSSLPLHGTLMRGDRPDVVIAPPAEVLDQKARLRRSLTSKVETYASHIRETESVFTVAVVAQGWKISEYGLISALLGNEVMELSRDNPQSPRSRFDGNGICSPGGAHHVNGSEILSAAWFLQAGMYQPDPPSLDVELSVLHNPFADRKLAPRDAAATRQLAPDGPFMTWVSGPENGTLILGST